MRWSISTFRESEHPDIANIFFKAGYIEAWGRGINKMISSCSKNGYPEPDFEQIAGGLQVTFRKRLATPKTTPKTTLMSVDNSLLNLLTKKETEILMIILDDKLITKEKIADLLKISIDGAKYHIRNMTKKGIFKWEGSTKNGYWKMNDL